jgi:MoaA/NifB/PqqE/SkfB family radical SAM enzyme
MRWINRLQMMRMFGRLVGRVPAGHLWYLLKRMGDQKPHRFNGQLRINTFFPPYPSIAFDRFCEVLVQRRRVPFSVYLAVTGRCPCRCPHCSYAGRSATDMPLDRVLDLVRQIKALGTSTLGLTGGEPTLCDDLGAIIRAAGPEMATVLFTTGYALDDRRAKRLADAGVSCVTVGIESADAAAHDRVRAREGSFAEAARAVRACLDAGIYTAVSTIGTRERIAGGDLEAMYELARQWSVGEFRLLAPVATGGWRHCASAMLTPQERQVLYDFHVRHNREPDGPAVNSFAYLESDAIFGCGAGYHHLFIDAAGQVCPCDLTPLSFGDATAEPLADIWQRMGEFFPLPRRACLMARIADRLPAAPPPLPLDRARSEAICPRHDVAEPLPEGYRCLLRCR